MGRSYLFECVKCGYRASVSGRSDRGPHLAVQTIHCLDCRELYDAVTELKVPVAPGATLNQWKLKPGPFDSGPDETPAPTFAHALNVLVVGSDKPLAWKKFRRRCPVSPRHRIRTWQAPGKCPKCGAFLDGSGLPARIWD
ncbi:MAG TPA: hypothetical protein PKN95_02505 [Verrucomicrobiota bacterium]|nr:hypothetical protein [Verrucomicrobiota bacterium]HNT13884.1 hypothetical protein [Verrucomicrobiota bacterium]